MLPTVLHSPPPQTVPYDHDSKGNPLMRKFAAVLAGAALAAGIALSGSTAASAAPQVKPPAVTWTCKAGERPIVVTVSRTQWKACMGVTKPYKIRLLGILR